MVGNNNLSDKEVMGVILDNYKLSATSLTNLILESANNQLRNDGINVLKKTLDHQKQIFDIMSQKGWYKVSSASQQDISNAQQQISNITSSMSM